MILSFKRAATAVAGGVIAASLMVSAAMAEPTRITFLHFNDLDRIAPKDAKGGFAPLMTLLAQERARAEHSVTTFGGDLISPSLMSGLTKGSQMVELMNAVGTDVAVVGNHEFDFGPEVAAKRIAESNFPWLGTNVLTQDGGQAVGTKPYHIMEAGGFKIGFFGLVTPETPFLSSPGEGIKFPELVATAKKAVEDLKAQGAEIIVGINHIDFADDRKLAAEVPGIHLLLGGHDHIPVNLVEHDVTLAEAGSQAHYLNVVQLDVEWVEKRGKKKLDVLPTWSVISTRGVVGEPTVQKIVDGHMNKLDQEMNVEIGVSETELDTRRSTVRSTESNFANLIADALKDETKADVAMTNGGGIRGDKTYDAGHKLTRKDVLSELPFGNVTVKLELTGDQLWQAVEHAVSKVEDGAGRFSHYSGMTMTYDPAKPAGERVSEILVGGKPLDKAKLYTLATNDYVANGGDGFKMFKESKHLIDKAAATLMATTVINYISEKGTIAPKVEGRISAQ
ncbi:bifunctional metallophosphatase/5'-nucleotidase [Aestuariispira insulae]|uniref:2',3'-cyclic-nucleotide 2'-phosphodiesterase (5'-nucleotidase family) n=1 Tax=Aestuariispira insulae TaxID=1461337 RepID=A0A3D9HR75_9PROT|nr:bifunctional UDP-sugar hydrolase/5'-nucleotidase [Aestuariispira insulae]RED52034.1 2',3'-cyclic-nucleotide 2'-phosphodiesterase (5'-nucleotidase family) [Aestuariispira insulae]